MDRTIILREWTEVIADILELAVDELTILMRDGKYHSILVRGLRDRSKRILEAEDRKALAQKLCQLKRKRLIKIDKSAMRLIISLTAGGERRLLESKIRVARNSGWGGDSRDVRHSRTQTIGPRLPSMVSEIKRIHDGTAEHLEIRQGHRHADERMDKNERP